MIGIRNAFRVALLAGMVCLATTVTRADIVLQQYEFQGQTGMETTLAPSFVTSGLTGVNFNEASVSPNAGVNSINSFGWTNPLANYSFGFTIQPGQLVTVDQLILTNRSSGTGPGFINVEASADGGPLVKVATITQTSTNYNDEFLAITPISANHSLTFILVAANQTSANGGTIGSAGTFRVGDYNPSGTPTPFTINGTITPIAVPEPSMLALGGLSAVISAGVWARRRKA